MKIDVWKKWTASLKNNIYALYLASQDTKLPLMAKIIISLVVAYALSPLDIIPDFIPVIGYLDDLLLLPLGIWLAIRLIPPDLWHECQLVAADRISEMPHSRRAAVTIVIIWLLIIGGSLAWVWQFVI